MNKLEKKYLNILESSKKHIIFEGWNNNVFNLVAKDLKILVEDINLLFPNGYKDLLKVYLNSTEIKMFESTKKLDLIHLRTQEKIFEIIKMRLILNNREKELIRRTFHTLLLPQNSIIATTSLYQTVDNIWYIAGDNSTDFNFYTKRALLANIYVSTFVYWLNKDENSLKKTEDFLIKKLNKTSLIPKIKHSISLLFRKNDNLFNIVKNFRK